MFITLSIILCSCLCRDTRVHLVWPHKQVERKRRRDTHWMRSWRRSEQMSTRKNSARCLRTCFSCSHLSAHPPVFPYFMFHSPSIPLDRISYWDSLSHSVSRLFHFHEVWRASHPYFSISICFARNCSSALNHNNM